MKRTLLFGALALAAMSIVPIAHAQESMSDATTGEGDMDDDRARGAFRLGRQYYERGQFAQAAAEFERAYGLSGRGQLLFNAYLAYRDAGDQANALRTLQGYLAAVPDAADREHLVARAAALSQSVTESEMREAQARAEAEEARLAQQEAEEAARQAREDASRPRIRHVDGEIWPWVVFGVGAAAAIGGAITGGLALSERGTLDSSCPQQLCSADFDLDGRRSGLATLALTTDVLLIAGGTIAVTGLVLGIVLGPHDEDLSAVGTTPAPTPPPEAGAACTTDGCVATLRTRF